jgi:hypothetical protein
MEFNMRTTTVTDTYTLQEDDEYLGINVDKPITIFLPDTTTEGRTITLKIETKQALSYRKVTIRAAHAPIDGYGNKMLQDPNQSVTLIFHADEWRII